MYFHIGDPRLLDTRCCVGILFVWRLLDTRYCVGNFICLAVWQLFLSGGIVFMKVEMQEDNEQVPLVAAVTPKLPDFWRGAADVWIAQVEAQNMV